LETFGRIKESTWNTWIPLQNTKGASFGCD
jgi:hypothetical protein